MTCLYNFFNLNLIIKASEQLVNICVICDGKLYFDSFSIVKYLSCDFALHAYYNYTHLFKKIYIYIYIFFLKFYLDSNLNLATHLPAILTQRDTG